MWNLFLDDLRNPVEDGWIICRIVEDAIVKIKELGIPRLISFDHDLGLEKTGYDLAKWLIEQDYAGKCRFPKSFEFIVHSANPVGRKNIHELLTGYFRRRRPE